MGLAQPPHSQKPWARWGWNFFGYCGSIRQGTGEGVLSRSPPVEGSLGKVLEAEPVHWEAVGGVAARTPFPSVPSLAGPREPPAVTLPPLHTRKTFYPWRARLRPSCKFRPNRTTRSPLRTLPGTVCFAHRVHARPAPSSRTPALRARPPPPALLWPHTQHTHTCDSSHGAHSLEHPHKPHTTHCTSHLPLPPMTHTQPPVAPCSYKLHRLWGLPSAGPDSEDRPRARMVSKGKDTGSHRTAGLLGEYTKSPGSGSLLLGGNVGH